MQYTELELTKLIADVEKEFTAHLAKAEDGEKPEKKPEGKPEKKPESEAKPEGEAAPAEAKPEGEAPPAEGAAPAGSEGLAAPAAQAGAGAAGAPGEGHDYDEEDMQHMYKMYASMSKGELKAHHDAIAELAKCGDMSASAAAPQPPTQEIPMAKSEEIKPIEVKVEPVKENQENVLLKTELSAANEKLEKLQKNFDAVQAFLTKLVEKKSAPAAKAITNLDAIAKSEGAGEEKPLSKTEIDSILSKKSQDPSLKKSDRDSINDYYLSGNYDVKGINHLLK